MTSDDSMDARLTALARRWADQANWLKLPGIAGVFDPLSASSGPHTTSSSTGPRQGARMGLGHPALP
jgi:hypothetical protein